MVVFGRGFKAVENDFGLAVGNVVAVLVGNKEQPRQGDEPDAAEADFDAHELLHVVAEDFSLVGAAVAVFVVQNDDAVAQREVKPGGAVGVGVAFGDPQAAAVVPGHRHRVLHIGFGGKDIALEPRRKLKPLGCLLRIQRRHRCLRPH